MVEMVVNPKGSPEIHHWNPKKKWAKNQIFVAKK